MTAELAAQNAAVIARMAARREVVRLRKNKKAVPAELLEKAGLKRGEAVPVEAAPVQTTNGHKKTTVLQHEDKCNCGVCGVVTRKDYITAVKARFPQIKGLVDAKVDELVSLLQAKEGDPVITTLQETWAFRCRARHDAWKAKKAAGAK